MVHVGDSSLFHIFDLIHLICLCKAVPLWHVAWAFISLKSFDVCNHYFSFATEAERDILLCTHTRTTYRQAHPFTHLDPPCSSHVFQWEVELRAVSSQ